jgi:DinB family protein
VKQIIFGFTFLLLFSAGAAVAQVEKSQDPRPETVNQVLDEWVTKIEQLVVPAAEVLPEEKYSFTPSAGQFAGVRTFADQVKHLAAANYQLGSRALGEQPPAGTKGETAPESVRTKAEIMEYVKGSFACLHRAAAATGAGNVVEPIKGTQGNWERTRLGLLIDALAHSSNHYGQMVEYLRMNSIIPPESR